MKTLKHSILIILIIFSTNVWGQIKEPGEPGGEPPSGEEPLGGSAPIGSGLLLLLGFSASYGSFKIIKKKTDSIEE